MNASTSFPRIAWRESVTYLNRYFKAMDPNANPATKRPTIQDRYEEVARQRRREEALARRNATPPKTPEEG